MSDRRWKIHVVVGLVLGFVATTPTATAGESSALFEGESHLDRHRLMRAVEERNPTVLSARSALEAALARPSQVGSLSDPMVSYTFAPQSVVSDVVPYGQVLRFSQHVPYPGKRRIRREIAEAESDAAAESVDTVRLRLALLTSHLFDDYYVIERAIEINNEHVELLEMFQRIATTRYAAGETSQQAPLRAEVEAAHLLHREVVLGTERAVLLVKLNELLHREPLAYVPPPPTELVVAEQSDAAWPGDRIEEALAARPELRAAGAALEARRLEIELARFESKPDFELMGSYNTMWQRSQHRFMVGAGVSLPLYRPRLRAAQAEAEAAARSLESDIAGLADRVRTEVTTAGLRLGEAQRVVSLYRSRLLPASSDQVSAALAGFRTGEVSFLALIEAERNQRSVKLEYEQALANVHRRRAELDHAVGRMEKTR
ncbi:MAG: TolC family protein [Acidobacteriota bacterium]|nr:TolC family protein [Acidobacteriota bacterium]